MSQPKNEKPVEAEEPNSNDREENRAARPPPKLAQTKIQIGMILKNWLIVERIGAGSFGETFTAVEVENPPVVSGEEITVTPEGEALLAKLPPPGERKEVCVKVEQENKNVLRLEALALKKVQSCKQVVRYYASGCTGGMNFLVMEKLGPNLAELRRRSPHGTFNIYTTLKAGISCLQAIRGVHSQGLVHRDIKPSNFVTGLVENNDQQTCYIIDFGLARRFMRSNGMIREARENAGFRGTSRYASVTSHHHAELGRVDDLWSLLFMLVEFATGTLPWRKYKDKEDIGRCKEESINPHLVRNLPREFQPFLAHLQLLKYEDEPDYDLLLGLMNRALERRGYPADKPVDWEMDPEALAREEEAAALAAQQASKPEAPPRNAQLPPPPDAGERIKSDTNGHLNGQTPTGRKVDEQELSQSNRRVSAAGMTPGNNNPPTLENLNVTPGNVLPDNSYTPAVQASSSEVDDGEDDGFSPRDKAPPSKTNSGKTGVEPLEPCKTPLVGEHSHNTKAPPKETLATKGGEKKPAAAPQKEVLKAKTKSKNCNCSVM
ncbi:Protein tyrosine kinase/Protein kinase domain containing protein, putative [Angomonas deanei]|uniref:non-specific serine/threonine protein kinase n=1 Tax=Angomonas deanei TaxID=59799 RepID=A0A7G2C841_9TRYP|nr:Protein tyrosine kinase/Protein kinase domain containing protein, putative [Angomonas deanei]